MTNCIIKNPLILQFTSQVSDVADDPLKLSKLLKYLTIIGIGYLQQAKRTQEQQQGNPITSGGAFNFAQIKKLAKANEKSWVSMMRQQLQQLQMQQVKQQQQPKYPQKQEDIQGIQSSFVPKYKKQFQENAGWKDDCKEKKKGLGTIGELKCLQLSQSSIHHPSVVSPTSNCPSSCRALALDFLSQNSLQRFEHENVVSHSPASNTPKDGIGSQLKEGSTIPIMENCFRNNNTPKSAILELDEKDISEQSAVNKRIREQRLTPKHTNFVNSLRRNDSERQMNPQSKKNSISPKHNNSNSTGNNKTNIPGTSNNNNSNNNTGSSQIALPAYLRNVQSKIADQVRHHRELSKGKINIPDNEENSLSPLRSIQYGSQFQSLNGSNNLGTPSVTAITVNPKTPINSKNSKNFNNNNNIEIDADVTEQQNALESLKTCHFRTKSSTSESLLTPTQDLRRKHSQFSQHSQNNNNIAQVTQHPFSSTTNGGNSTYNSTFKDTFSNVKCESKTNSQNNSSSSNNNIINHSSSGFFAGSLHSSQHQKNNVLEIAQHFLTSPLMKQLYPKDYQQKDQKTTTDRLAVTSEILQNKHGQQQQLQQQMQNTYYNGVVSGDKSHLNSNTKTGFNEGNKQILKMNNTQQLQHSRLQSSIQQKELSSYQEGMHRTNKEENTIDDSKFQHQRYQWKMSQSGLFNNNNDNQLQKQQQNRLTNDENHNNFSGLKQSTTPKHLQQHSSFMNSLNSSHVMSPFHAGEESKIFFRQEFERQIQMKTSSMTLDNNNNNYSLTNNSQNQANKGNYNLPQTPADQSDISFNAGDLSASLFPSSRPLFQH